MSALRYMNDVDVQGWDPTHDGGASAEAAAQQLPLGTGGSPTSTSRMNTRTPSNPARQGPSTRARAATCPNIYDFTFMLRPGPTPVQQQKPGTSVSAYGYGSSTQPYAPSSARNAAAAGRSGSRPRSSTERKFARKLAENANYVPRPKNSFILFRTEFVAQRTGGGIHSDSSSRSSNQRSKSEDEDEETTQSLSKQASEVWNKMSEEEKKPWAERAKLEKAAHEARYPNYRYKPVRHNPARKSLLPPGSSKDGQSPPRRPSLSLPRTISETSTTESTDSKEDGMSPTSTVDAEHQFSTGYQSSIASSSATTLDSTQEMPSPLQGLELPTASPSSSSLANALGTRPPTPSLPTIPPVPTLTLTEAGPSRATGLPPIPRSPSAPVFDRRAIGQFPYQQQRHFFTSPSTGSFQTQNSYLSASSSFTMSPPPNSSSLQTNVPNSQGMISPLSSVPGSDTTVQSSLPTPENTEPDYFRDFVRCDSDDLTAGPAPSSFTNQQLFTTNENDYEKLNDNTTTHYELDEMDVDMRALLNLSPLPEVAEPESGTTDVQRPFDAIAALWVQDQQRMNNTTETRTEVPFQATSPTNQAHSQVSPKALDSTAVFQSSSKNLAASDQEVGLDTYGLAVGADYFNNCTPNTCLEDDLLRLDLDFRPHPTSSRLSCALASTLNFDGDGTGTAADIMTESDAGAVAGDIFGYDRERGLYGFDGFGFGPASSYGYGYGNELLGVGVGNASPLPLDYGF